MPSKWNNALDPKFIENKAFPPDTNLGGEDFISWSRVGLYVEMECLMFIHLIHRICAPFYGFII